MRRKNKMSPQKKSMGYLEEINQQFYILIKKLQNKKFAESSQITALAYEIFMKELSKKISRKRLN